MFYCKYKSLLLTAALFFILSSSKAQVDNKEEKVLPRYKWEVGLVNPQLLFTNGTTGVLGKKYTDKNGRKGAYRLGAGFSASRQRSQYMPTLLPARALDPTTLRSSLNLGYEWQRQTGYFMFFYGSDLTCNYLYDRQDDRYAPVPQSLSVRNEITPGVEGFFGAKFFILPHLSVSAETSLRFQYTYSNALVESYDAAGALATRNRTLGRVPAIYYLPVNLFYISYHF